MTFARSKKVHQPQCQFAGSQKGKKNTQIRSCNLPAICVVAVWDQIQPVAASRTYLIIFLTASRRMRTRPMGLVPSTWYLVPSTWYQVLGTWYQVLSTWYQVLGTWYQVLSTWYQVLGTKYLVLGTKYLVLGTKYLVPST